MPKVTESLTMFMTAKKRSHNGPDLVDRFLAHGCNMEVQVNVAPGEGEPVPGKRSTYTDGVNEWVSFRIPRNADSTPEFRDWNIKFPLDLHAEAIGSTGWDWKARRSRWVGFDFDAITGHAAGIGVADEQLDKVRAAAERLDYVESRKSTGGAGLHLYVMFEDSPAFNTANHTEHAALGRYILGLMSRDCDFDFSQQIDACGGNLWIWHRKANKTNEGLKLIKAGEPFPASKLSDGWRSHIAVARRERAKVQLGDDVDLDVFEQLAQPYMPVSRDAKHRQIMEEIAKLGIVANWQNDYHCFQTHTIGFKRLIERRDELGLVGVFDTLSDGTDLRTPNCYGFLLPNGGFKLYRFKTNREAATWERGQSEAYCSFNVRPSLKLVAKATEGTETLSGGVRYDTLQAAADAAKALGGELSVDDAFQNRKATVTQSKDKLCIQVKRDEDDPRLPGWDAEKKGVWTKVIDVEPPAVDHAQCESIVRAMADVQGNSAGWAIKNRKGEWEGADVGTVKRVLQSTGLTREEAEIRMGAIERNRMKLTNIPFQPDYPAPNVWNRGAAQLKYPPAPRSEDNESRHQTWNQVLDHAGADLTPYLRELTWARQAGITTGGLYHRAWIACAIRYPFRPLPYLFAFGVENSGKSILWELWQFLITAGIAKADRVLRSANEFNGELAGAIVCAVEERDVSDPAALARIKDLVTSPWLSIRMMRRDVFQVRNMSHWIQVANDKKFCPTFPDDTRITAFEVHKLEDAEGHSTEIKKEVLEERLAAEAPYFLRTILDMELPPSTGRLRLPVVETRHKSTGINSDKERFLFQFVHDYCAFEGRIAIARFYELYEAAANVAKVEPLPKTLVTKALGKMFGGKIRQGNAVQITYEGKRQKAYDGLRERNQEDQQ